MRLLWRLEYERSCGASWLTYFVSIALTCLMRMQDIANIGYKLALNEFKQLYFEQVINWENLDQPWTARASLEGY